MQPTLSVQLNVLLSRVNAAHHVYSSSWVEAKACPRIHWTEHVRVKNPALYHVDPLSSPTLPLHERLTRREKNDWQIKVLPCIWLTSSGQKVKFCISYSTLKETL